MNNELHSNSRFGYRSKRKKTNLILNSLIVIVLLLIIFVGYMIFASPGSNSASSQKKNQVTAAKTTNKSSTKNNAASDQTQTSDTNGQTNQQNQNSQSNQDNQNNQQSTQDTSSATANSDQSQAVVQTGGSSPNVIKTIVNPAWKPVGTSQTGQHTPQYDENSVDWQEMLSAITYATGLPQNNMIVQFLGRDRTTPNASIGTVYSKDKQQIYRVYIKWVDGQGWEPTKVEELSSLQ